MSTKSKLLAMTGDLQLPQDAAAGAADGQAAALPRAAAELSDDRRFPPVVPRSSAARTGPGQMLQFRGQMLAVESEIGQLREQLKAHEGADPTRALDAASVLPSRWANRHADAFGNAAFARLKQDIEIAGGNVQPIMVRPLADQPGHYEIVFGHRRHRACAELGLPVLATIASGKLSDLDMFKAMERENRERADLSPYEQGLMYRRALDDGLYPSNRRLAEALGVSHTWVANVLMVADLPTAVLECFRSPLEVQHRHAKLLAGALDLDRKAVLRRAERLRQQGRALAAGAVVAALLAPAAAPASALATASKATGQAGPGAAPLPAGALPVELAGQAVGHCLRDEAGHWCVQLDAGVQLDDTLAAAVLHALRQAAG